MGARDEVRHPRQRTAAMTTGFRAASLRQTRRMRRASGGVSRVQTGSDCSARRQAPRASAGQHSAASCHDRGHCVGRERGTTAWMHSHERTTPRRRPHMPCPDPRDGGRADRPSRQAQSCSRGAGSVSARRVNKRRNAARRLDRVGMRPSPPLLQGPRANAAPAPLQADAMATRQQSDPTSAASHPGMPSPGPTGPATGGCDAAMALADSRSSPPSDVCHGRLLKSNGRAGA